MSTQANAATTTAMVARVKARLRLWFTPRSPDRLAIEADLDAIEARAGRASRLLWEALDRLPSGSAEARKIREFLGSATGERRTA